ncbi:DNA-binding PadR family transcriptional regulator [Undibacterium sp. GrIS 1.8]|uniref:PadR family transcriptional regulator n=1 Tax=Undibacterium sp. GrIS 1.8 TaxID=3143934 RepID=UPI0033983D90
MVESTNPRGRRTGSNQGLTTADLVVLSLLAERPMHGYDLLAEYQRQEVADWASISKAQLYYALKKLDAMKLLGGNTEDGAARDRTIYRPTADGLAALSAGLAATTWASSRVAQPFTTWFGLSVHASPEAQQEILRARLSFLVEEIAKEKRSLEFITTLSAPRALKGASIVQLTINQLQVELEWVKTLMS